MIKVVAARHVNDYVIWLRFSDGTEGEVDLRDELYREVFEPLKSPDVFKTSFVNPGWGTIAWTEPISPRRFCTQQSRCTRRKGRFSFTIDLLADPKHELLNAAGVGQSDYKGTMYGNRTSFVIDPAGTLRKVYEKVNPEGHERVLLDDNQGNAIGSRTVQAFAGEARRRWSQYRES